MPTRAVVLVLAGVAVLVALFLVLRPDDDSAAEPAPPPATATATETETDTDTDTDADADTETEPPPPPPAPEVEVVSIRVRDGRVEGGGARPTFEQGDQIRLVVRADVADHVHVHSYDLMRDVGPGRPAQLAFEATLTGRFEVELEDAGLPIAELTVRP